MGRMDEGEGRMDEANKKTVLSSRQGWQFAHQFSKQIPLFFQKNEQMSDSLKKQEIGSFAHFW